MKTFNPETLKVRLIKVAKHNQKHPSPNPRMLDFKTVLPGYQQKAGIFKGSNWSFNPETLYADSYNWWPMLKVIKGTLVRNTCNYSRSTAKHQYKVDRIMRALGIKADIEISVKASLNNPEAVAKELLEAWADHEVKNKYGRKPTKNLITKQIEQLTDARIIKVTKKAMKQALAEAEADRQWKLDHKLSIKNVMKCETDSVRIEIRYRDEFSTNLVVGQHVRPDHIRDVWDAVESASRDMSETVYVYIKQRPAPKVPELKLGEA